MVEHNNQIRMLQPDVDAYRIEQILSTAQWAGERFSKMNAETVRRVAYETAQAAHARSLDFAKGAVEETGYGRVKDKVIKNEACSKGIFDLYGDLDFASPRIDEANKIVELPRPAGVIFALIPVTNPVATVYFKALLALMTRNAIIISPHPAAKKVCVEAARLMAQAAHAAGAPAGLIQVIEEPTIPLIDKFISNPMIDLVLATGGPSVVKAAYKSGHPAIGVGSGNAPVLVDDTANLRKAAECIVTSKSFDNSVLCTNESVILAFENIAHDLLEKLKHHKAYICRPHEVDALRTLLYTDTGFNVDMLGKDASFIAKQAGFSAQGAEILVAPIDSVQPEEPLVREKLCPVIAFKSVGTIEEALVSARSVMRKSGQGHSAVVHSENERHILAFAETVPALRVCVNVGLSLGASGFETNLEPSMTIGTGFVGGSSLGGNLQPEDLVNTIRIAYNKSSDVPFGNFEGLSRETVDAEIFSSENQSYRFEQQPSLTDANVQSELRRLIQAELQDMLKK